MRCTNCGNEVSGGSFCPQCGAPLAQQPVQQYPANSYQAQQPPVNAVQPPVTQTLGNPTQVLVFGILSLALSGLGVVGLIFAILAMTKATKYFEEYGNISTQVRVGRGLGIGGLVVSILMMIIYVIYFILFVFVLVNAATTHTSYHF